MGDVGIMLTDDDDSFITVNKVNWNNLNADEIFKLKENRSLGEVRPPFTYVKVWFLHSLE